jgi:hypothetical protein
MALFSVVYNTPVQWTVTFTVGGVVTDPTAVTFRVKRPNAAVTESAYVYGVDSQPTKVSTGVYRLRYDPAEAGLHRVRAEGTGACNADIESEFEVLPSQFTAAA